MRPYLIGIGGGGSGAGKTEFACRLLRRLRNFGAIKYTKTAIYSSVCTDPDILRQSGKDTALMLESGATAVIWVQSPPEDLSEPLNIAVDRLSNLEGIIIEGNSAIELLTPDIVIFIYGGQQAKKTSIGVFESADVIVADLQPDWKTKPGARIFKTNKADEAVEHVIEIAERRKDKRDDNA